MLRGLGRIDLEWARGRMFDQDVAQLFQLLVKEARTMRCTAVAAKEERRQRPHGELVTCVCMLCFVFRTWQTLFSYIPWHRRYYPILEMAAEQGLSWSPTVTVESPTDTPPPTIVPILPSNQCRMPERSLRMFVQG